MVDEKKPKPASVPKKEGKTAVQISKKGGEKKPKDTRRPAIKRRKIEKK